jgi:cyclase
MFRPRVIPVLLLRERALVKSLRFKLHRYIGDPINAVRVFNELRADELVFLDIDASREQRLISLDLVRDIGEEASMPFSVGGGISTIENIKDVLAAGAEKVVINTHAGNNPDFIRQASDRFGSSTIVVCVDVKTRLFKGERAWICGGSRATPFAPIEFARLMEAQGAGELIIQSIDNDGMMTGYDIALTRSIADAVSIPVIALGGAGTIDHLVAGYRDGRANGLGAGSMFVYQNTRRGVLINYPDKSELTFE